MDRRRNPETLKQVAPLARQGSEGKTRKLRHREEGEASLLLLKQEVRTKKSRK